jgi:hypothetical protein
MSGKAAAGVGAKGIGGAGKGGKAGIGKGEGGKQAGPADKKKPVSRSVKAGLQFPVGRIHRFLKVRLAVNGYLPGTCLLLAIHLPLPACSSLSSPFPPSLPPTPSCQARSATLNGHPATPLPRRLAPLLAAVSVPPQRCTAPRFLVRPNGQGLESKKYC